MRLASTLLVLVAACSTSKARTASSEGGRASPSPIARTVADAAERRLIQISAFDCEKHEEFPGLPAQKGPVSPANGIRAWHGGGPGGANWNVGDLRCVVRLSTTCERGRVDLVLRVGKSVVAQRTVEVKAGTLDVEMPLPQKAWRAHVDEPIKKFTADVPYRTAAFRAFAAADCVAPSEANLKNSGYRDVAADDSFVAGFASGE